MNTQFKHYPETNHFTKIIITGLLLAVFALSSSCKEDEKDNGLLDEWILNSLTSGSFADQNNGTVLDSGSGRTWMKCTQGQLWNPSLNTCTGTGSATFYGAASMAFCDIAGDLLCVDATLQANSGPAYTSCANLVFAGFSDWRLPTKIELLTIVTSLPSRATLLTKFPETPDDKSFWAGDQNTDFPASGYGISFAEGTYAQVLGYDKNSASLYVRCIR
ncbi:MAG: DUF1566 domain-containing protein [Spirochaetia bacterium]|nr:DUF1566 domain-containing protein [Spirochaetia bacterium]